MKKIFYLLKEAFYLIRRHKLYFFGPIIIILVLLAILAFYIGPSVIISFLYAGA